MCGLESILAKQFGSEKVRREVFDIYMSARKNPCFRPGDEAYLESLLNNYNILTAWFRSPLIKEIDKAVGIQEGSCTYETTMNLMAQRAKYGQIMDKLSRQYLKMKGKPDSTARDYVDEFCSQHPDVSGEDQRTLHRFLARFEGLASVEKESRLNNMPDSMGAVGGTMVFLYTASSDCGLGMCLLFSTAAMVGTYFVSRFVDSRMWTAPCRYYCYEDLKETYLRELC